MDSKTIECAFRLHNLIESKHNLSRGLDLNTRRIISHITNKHASSSNTSREYTKEGVQADLELLADGIFAATVQQLIQAPGPTHSEMEDIVTKAVDKCFSFKLEAPAPPPPSPPSVDKITSALVQALQPVIQDLKDEYRFLGGCQLDLILEGLNLSLGGKAIISAKERAAREFGIAPVRYDEHGRQTSNTTQLDRNTTRLDQQGQSLRRKAEE